MPILRATTKNPSTRSQPPRWASWLGVVLLFVFLHAAKPPGPSTPPVSIPTNKAGRIPEHLRERLVRYGDWLLLASLLCGIGSLVIGAAYDGWWAGLVLASSSFSIGLPFGIWTSSRRTRAGLHATHLIGLSFFALLILAVGMTATICTNSRHCETELWSALSTEGITQWAPVYVTVGFTLLGVLVCAVWVRLNP